MATGRSSDMLERIEIENFRCLKSVNVPLRPLTVLIGPNDSGKSAFLKAIRFLVNGPNIGEMTDHWRHDLQVAASVRGSTPLGTTQVTDLNGPETGPAWQSLRPLGFFQLPSQGVSMSSSGHNDAGGPPLIGENGDGVPTFVDYLVRRDHKRFNHAVDAVRR